MFFFHHLKRYGNLPLILVLVLYCTSDYSKSKKMWSAVIPSSVCDSTALKQTSSHVTTLG